MNCLLTRLEILNVTANFQDGSSAFVSKSVFAAHHHIANVAMFPEMNIRATDPSSSDMDKAVVRARLRDLRVNKMERVFWVRMNSNVARLALSHCHCCHGEMMVTLFEGVQDCCEEWYSLARRACGLI